MKYFLKTFGCQVNKSDSERIAFLLEKLGYKKVSTMENADLLIFNTCSVRQSAEDRIFGLKKSFKYLKKKNTGLKIVLTGCMIHYGEKQLKKRIPELDIVLNIRDLNKLPELIGKSNNIIKFDDYLSLKPKRSSKISAYIPISFGCDNVCSYCIVPYARKKEYSRPIDDVLKDIEQAVKNGHKEIWLLGQNVNAYKSEVKKPVAAILKDKKFKIRNNSINFAELLRLVNKIRGNFWIRFTSPHPKNFSDELINVLKHSKKYGHYLNLPLQSGDDDILKKMNRGYTVKEYLMLIKKIRKAMPDISISTDIIVGFPSETRKQFFNTVKIFKTIGFDMAYISEYSPRPKTAAFFMKDNVSKKEKEYRKKYLNNVLIKSSFLNNKKYVGKIVDVLIENKRNDGFFEGHTKTYKSVILKDKCKKNLIGEFVKIKIIKARDFGLEGKLEKE